MKQRGVALITAIVLVAIATVLAVHIGTRASLDIRRTAGLVALDQAWQVALGAEAWAIQVLKEDAQDSQNDNLSEAWAQPIPALPVDGGEVRGALEDMQGRFNVNSLLLAEDEVAKQAAIARFERLLTLVGAQPRWALILADWIDPETVPNFPEGAEDGVYLAQSPPYRAANGPISTVTELLALPGMTLDEFQRIRPYIAALPVNPTIRINLCTAKAPVLAALLAGETDFGDADILESNRRGGCFPTVDMLKNLPGVNFEALEPLVSDSSNWFRVVTAVRIGTSELTLYSLIERTSSGSGRTVLRSTGTE